MRFFFFSSRRRHTIFDCDWSSDVCSSDLSGYKVYPDEVDRVLMSHPAVLEAATIGVPDPKRGETVKSFVVLRVGMSATAEQILAYCRESLAPYKVPREVEFRTELPKSAALKILRRELQEEEVRTRTTSRS